MRFETDIKTLPAKDSAAFYGALSRAPGFIRKDLGADLNAAPDQPGGILVLQRACWRYWVSVNIDTRATPACSMAAITFATGP